MELFLELLPVSLGSRDRLSQVPAAQDWKRLYKVAYEQALVGVLMQGLDRLPEEQRPPMQLLLKWVAFVQKIQIRSGVMDRAVVKLCQDMKARGIRVLLFKGQTLARSYPDATLRHSGDIDFLVHPADEQKALEWLHGLQVEDLDEDTAERHINFQLDKLQYEMHRKMAIPACPKHRRYWERVVMPEIWNTATTVNINGQEVPTLSPVYNMLYVFVHIYQHLMSEGIGFRQFVDWYHLAATTRFGEGEKALLERHLRGLGLYNAFCGIGALLTDCLGLDGAKFPFPISAEAHRQVPVLVKNMLEKGNFGHNQRYRHGGIRKDLRHVQFIVGQARLFRHYAPLESSWIIPNMTRWWLVRGFHYVMGR